MLLCLLDLFDFPRGNSKMKGTPIGARKYKALVEHNVNYVVGKSVCAVSLYKVVWANGVSVSPHH